MQPVYVVQVSPPTPKKKGTVISEGIGLKNIPIFFINYDLKPLTLYVNVMPDKAIKN